MKMNHETAVRFVEDMHELLWMVNRSNLPPRQQQRVATWFKCLSKINTPEKLDTLLELLEVHHD